jgi:hypothetical protein
MLVSPLIVGWKDVLNGISLLNMFNRTSQIKIEFGDDTNAEVQYLTRKFNGRWQHQERYRRDGQVILFQCR